MKKNLSISIVIIALLQIVNDVAIAATYYMGTNGSNYDNGSESAPWLTLQYSISQMDQ